MSLTGSSSWSEHDKCCNHFHCAVRSPCLQQILALQLLPSLSSQYYSVVTSPLLPWHHIRAMHLQITFQICISPQMVDVYCHDYVALQACCRSSFMSASWICTKCVYMQYTRSFWAFCTAIELLIPCRILFTQPCNLFSQLAHNNRNSSSQKSMT